MPTRLLRPAALTLLLVFGGCTDEPFEGKTVAAASAPVAASEAAKRTGKSLAFSDEGSRISWLGAKVTRTHEGSFEKFSGTIDLADTGIAGSRVLVSIQMDSITSDTDKLTTHLKNDDFFAVEKFPAARFESTSVKPIEGSEDQYSVTGNLTLRDTTKSITFPASIQKSGGGVKVDTEFVINRQDFGITYPGLPDDLIKNEVLIRLNIHAPTQG